MAPISTQSMRHERTCGNMGMTSRSTRSIPVNLEDVESQDSSVFEGLDKVTTPRNGPPEEIRTKRKIPAVRFQQEDPTPRTRPTHVGRYKLKSLGNDDGESEFGDGGTAIVSVVRSSSNSSSEQSYMRSMKPITDNDSAFATESTEMESEVESHMTEDNKRYNSNNSTHHQSRNNDHYNRYGQSSYLHDQDLDSHISYGSVNSYDKPRGTFNMVSQVNYFDTVQEEEQENEASMRSGNEERITAMLDDYEKQMEATLESLTLDDDNRDDVLIDRDYLSEMQDIVPRRVKSDDAHQTLTNEQSKKLRKVLHQARTEVEVLKDNNEQFMSEIEQQEEEYLSEKKLFEERTRQKITELKNMYQEEMEHLIREKDAAIVEASRQAARYGESGRKQIASLKSQLEKVKSQANGVVRQKIEEAIKTIHNKKEEEMTARLGALRKSYENEFEKIKNERENHVQIAVNQAVASATHRLLADGDQQLNDSMQVYHKQLEIEKHNAVHSANQSLVVSQKEASALRQEREGLVKTLESIKENIDKHYPSQMTELREKSRGTSGPFKLFQNQQKSEDNLEKIFKEVIESFGFLLDNSSTKVVSYDLVEIEDLKKKIKEQEGKLSSQKEEMESIRKEKKDDKNKIERSETTLRNMEKEKRLLEEEHQRGIDSRWDDIQKMHSADEVFQHMEKRRNNLAEAMAVGQIELKNTMSNDRQHFLKPVNHFQAQQSNSADRDCSADTLHYMEKSTGDQEKTIQSSSSSIHPPTSFDQILDVSSTADQSKRMAVSTSGPSSGKEGDARYESPAKKKSYAILRNFKSSRHQRSTVPLEDSEGTGKESTPARKALTRAQKIRGYFESRRHEDDSSRTLDSLTDESISSLRTNTGEGGAKKTEPLTTTSEGDTCNIKRPNARTSNPLGMFAQAKKDKTLLKEEEDSENEYVGIPPPPRPKRSGTNTTTLRPVQEQRDTSDQGEALQSNENVTKLPTSFKKMALPGFSHPPQAFVLNGKKPSVEEFEAETMTTGPTYSGFSEQENSVPVSIAMQSSSRKNLVGAAVNGHTMCLRPLPVDNSNEQVEDNVSILSENNSLQTASETVPPSDGSLGLQKHMRSYQSLTDASDDEESGDPFVVTDTMSSDSITMSSDRYATPKNLAPAAPAAVHRAISSHESRPVVVQGQYIPEGREQRTNVRSPTSDATTAVVSHRYKPNVSGFYNTYGDHERKSVRVARVADRAARASNFASRVRARRVDRRPAAI